MRRITFNSNQETWLPWILLIAIAAIYLCLPTKNYYWDGIAFALQSASKSKHRFLDPLSFSLVSVTITVAAYCYSYYLITRTFDFHRFMQWTTSFSPGVNFSFNLWNNQLANSPGSEWFKSYAKNETQRALITKAHNIRFVQITPAK